MVRLLLLEARDSAHWTRIEHAAQEAGLSIASVVGVEAVPANAALVGVGPSVPDPLHVARYLRQIGSQALLVFFTASRSARDAVYAELVRDPFLYPRYELIEIPDSARKLASRMGQVVVHAQRQPHPSSARHRPRRSRSVPSQAAHNPDPEHYLANILDQANEAILSTDAAGRVLTWNSAAQRLFGFEARSILGQPLDLLAAPGESADDRPAAMARRVLASGEAEQGQVTVQTPGGENVQTALSVAPVRDTQGTLLGLSLIARDNSDYKRIEEALLDAHRQKDEFLAIMSHELRTPLTSILGYTDMLLRGLSGPLPPMTHKYLGNVRSAGDRLLELVNGLLDYTRLEAGVERLELSPVDLTTLVTQAVQHFKDGAQGKQIDMRLVIAGSVGRVEADYEKLTHVVRSLLGNALKFTPGGGWVSVHVGADPDASDTVRVSVADSGIGLQQEQVPRVWERFYQGDASLTRPYGGMGLGLSIARHLVTLHGGTVGAASGGPGMGSTFWFSLPLGRSNK
jgi:PAS domain S-box-containing protein